MKTTFDEGQDLIKMWAGRAQKLRDYFDSHTGDKKIQAMFMLAEMVLRCQRLISKSYDAVTDLTKPKK